jgi:hypothetical protein
VQGSEPPDRERAQSDHAQEEKEHDEAHRHQHAAVRSGQHRRQRGCDRRDAAGLKRGASVAAERPIEKMRKEVRQGYVSVKAAEELYGVVIDAVSSIVDVRATEKKRAEMAKG